MTADVVVVGAGPAGSATAAFLARAGLRVRLLEKSVDGLPAKVCGEYLSPGCLPMLQRLDVLAPLRQLGRELRGMIIHTPSGACLRASYPNVGGPSAGPARGLSVTRTHLDSALLDLAVKHGVVYEPGFQVGDIRVGGPQAEVHGRLGGREVCRLARLVIGADGRHSVVARTLGALQRHPWLDKMAFVAYLEGVRRDDHYGEIFLGRDRYAILNPIADDLTNLGIVMSRRALSRGEDPRQRLWSAAKSLPGLAPRLREVTLAAPPRCLGPLAQRAASVSGPRQLLVGDAAGFFDPFTGEGIYAALRSADLATQRVLTGWTAIGPRPEELARYASDWHREFDPKWRFAMHLQRAIRHPALAEWIVWLLAHRSALAATLLAAAGDLIPPEHLSLGRLLLRGCVRHAAEKITAQPSSRRRCPRAEGAFPQTKQPRAKTSAFLP